MRLAKDRPLTNALRFLLERHRALLGVSVFIFAIDTMTVWVANMTLVIIAVFAVVRALVRGVLRPGLLRSLDSARQGDALSVDELMSGFDCFEHAVGVQVLTDVVTFASFAVGALPGLAIVLGAPGLFVPGVALAMAGGFALYLYAFAGVRFAEHVVALERLGALTAMRRSWKLASGNRLRILHAIFVASTLEVLALIWGIGAFGFGMLLSIPYVRLAGDHALVVLFANLETDDVAPPASARSGARWSLAPARGASLIEYALIIVAIMVFAAGTFRVLGASTGKTANEASKVLAANGTNGDSVLSSLGISSAAASVMSPVGSFLSDFTSGLVKGDFSDAKGFGKTAGQIVGGFIPVYGQIAAARDMGAAIRDISNGKQGGWANLGMASIGLIPGGKAVGVGIKGAAEAAQVAKAAEEAAALAKTARAAEDAAKVAAAAKAESEAAAAAVAAAKKAADEAKQAEQFGEGASSKVFRDGDNVKKVVKDEVAADGGNLAKITPSEKDFIAKNTVDLTNELHDAMPNMVPKMSSPSPGVISQPFVEGKSISQLNAAAQKNAKQQMKDAVEKAHDTIGLENGGHGEFPNGFLAKVDTNSANFRFDSKGNITSWFDPISIVPPSHRGILP